MEPIDYRDALSRRWRLILALALVGAVVGVLVPLKVPYPPPRTMYQTTALVGTAPGGTTPTVGQIVFYSANQQVMSDAAHSVGISKVTPALEKDLVVATRKKGKSAAGSPNGTVTIAVKQPTAVRSARLTNAFSQSLGNYIQTQLNNDYQNKLELAQQSVCNLQEQVNAVDAQIATIVAPNGGTAPQGVSNPLCTNSGSGSGGSSNSGSSGGGSTTSTVYRVPGATSAEADVVLADVVAAGAASTTTDPKSTTTTAPTTTTTTSTPSTGRSNPDLADLQAQNQALTSQYVAATQRAQALSDAGAPQSLFTVLQPALVSQAKQIPGGLSLLDHRSVRALLGLLAGAAVGAGIALLLAGLDKHLRTVARARETFGFPVVAEIPQYPRFASNRRLRRPVPLPPPPPVPVVSDPTSPQAEAYRMLRMAVDLGPLAVAGDGEVPPERARPNGGDHPGLAAPGTRAPLPAPAVPVAQGAVSTAGTPLWLGGSGAGAGEPSHASGAVLPVAVSGPESGRRVVLVLSPGVEATSRQVSANLGATYVESGLQALLITTDDLRQGARAAPGGLFRGADGIGVADVVSNSEPSGILGVRHLPLGRLLDGPGQLARRAPEIVAVAKQTVDVVIVEAMAMLATHDAEALVPTADVVVVVGECGTTTVGQATQAGDLLRRVGAPVVGAVLTEVPVRSKDARTANPTPAAPSVLPVPRPVPDKATRRGSKRSGSAVKASKATRSSKKRPGRKAS